MKTSDTFFENLSKSIAAWFDDPFTFKNYFPGKQPNEAVLRQFIFDEVRNTYGSQTICAPEIPFTPSRSLRDQRGKSLESNHSYKIDAYTAFEDRGIFWEFKTLGYGNDSDWPDIVQDCQKLRSPELLSSFYKMARAPQERLGPPRNYQVPDKLQGIFMADLWVRKGNNTRHFLKCWQEPSIQNNELMPNRFEVNAIPVYALSFVDHEYYLLVADLGALDERSNP